MTIIKLNIEQIKKYAKKYPKLKTALNNIKQGADIKVNRQIDEDGNSEIIVYYYGKFSKRYIVVDTIKE